MSRERFEQVDRLFRAALGVDAAHRIAFLQRTCRDEHVRREVLGLLAEDGATRGALDRPALGAPIGLAELDRLADAAEATAPIVVPGYRILRRIGGGGMGIVFEAEQESPRRRVALKIMRSAVPSPDAARRFRLEAHALARLQHPNIAQIFAAGSFEGPAGVQPYLAMEFVEGEVLGVAARRRDLSIGQRVELVAATCDALQHAHQRGVIHRDLKPANILVVDDSAPSGGSGSNRTPDGELVGLRPKVLDFGVARVLEEGGTTRATLDGQLVGTIPYMSPEQAASASDDVDTRSDVYAIGVIAFELLTGRLPYDLGDKGPLDAARVIRDEDPLRLSSIDRRLAGDLESVIGKALEKDRDARYQSASEFAADLRRFLRGEPVSAQPHTAWARTSAYFRRHRVAAAVIGGITAPLCIAMVVVALALAAAIRERDEASRQASIARAVNAFLDEDLLAAVDPEETRGAAVTVRALLDRAALAIDYGRFASEPAVEAAIRQTIGRSYRKLGLLVDADRHLLRARVLHRDALGEDHPDTLASRNELANLRLLQGRAPEAESLYRGVLAAKRRSLGDRDRSTILAYGNLAAALRDGGALEDAVLLQERAYALATAHLAEDNPYRIEVVRGLAGLYRSLDRLDESERLFRAALALSRAVHGDDGKHTLRIMNSLALLEMKRGRHGEAEVLLTEAITRHAAQVGRRHPNLLAYLANLGHLLAETGRWREAAEVLDEVLQASREVLGEEHHGTLAAMRTRAKVHAASGEPDRAAALYAELEERWTRREGADGARAEAARAARRRLSDERPD